MMSDEDRTFIPLLTLLEATCEESGLDPATARALVRYALTSDSRYWAGRALGWVGHGVEASTVTEELRAFSRRDRSWPQALRHRAKRLTPRA